MLGCICAEPTLVWEHFDVEAEEKESAREWHNCYYSVDDPQCCLMGWTRKYRLRRRGRMKLNLQVRKLKKNFFIKRNLELSGGVVAMLCGSISVIGSFGFSIVVASQQWACWLVSRHICFVFETLQANCIVLKLSNIVTNYLFDTMNTG